MIGIIGAGLSGLTAAKVLSENNVDFRVVEDAGQVGGRVRTDKLGHFLLDRGFQVLLSSYPQAQRHLDYKKLKLKKYPPGAHIMLEPGKLVTVSDPLRDPLAIFKTLKANIGNLSDKFKVLKLQDHPFEENESTFEFLQSAGLSTEMIELFFRPFFSGIFLERELRSKAEDFVFLFEKFSKGYATLPEGGMQQICEQLAAPFFDKIDFGQSIVELNSSEEGVEVIGFNNRIYNFDKVILATEAPAANRLLGKVGLIDGKRGVTTVYFWSQHSPSKSKYLFLNGTGKGRVNHISIISNVNSSYAPDGLHLISVNILGVERVFSKDVLEEVQSWEVFENTDWHYLKTYYVPYAQPESPLRGSPLPVHPRIILAGDYTQTASIEGAMKSGEMAAKLVLS